MKNIAILGSTGSIGTQTLDVIEKNPDKFKVKALSVNTNIELLKEQIEKFKPEAVSVMDKAKADQLKVDIPVYSGLEGLKKIATLESADTIVTSVVGSIGLEPTIAAIKAKKNIALANKETLVTAGQLVMREAKKNNITIMPIDSEHSALFQCLNGEDIKKVRRLIITCSGGPFRNKPLKELIQMKASDALKHPTWKMGAKITIDSSTLMNKGFEVIEAKWLYNINNIDVVVHPQSIIHSMVEYVDRSIMAQLGTPDMRIPIQYALSYPKRIKNELEPLDITKQDLTFEKPDTKRFPCLSYAFEALEKGGTLAAVINAANEVVVKAFLEDKITFMQIPQLIRQAMDNHNIINRPELQDILDVDKQTRIQVAKCIR